jgi:hypothetical protein
MGLSLDMRSVFDRKFVMRRIPVAVSVGPKLVGLNFILACRRGPCVDTRIFDSAR